MDFLPGVCPEHRLLSELAAIAASTQRLRAMLNDSAAPRRNRCVMCKDVSWPSYLGQDGPQCLVCIAAASDMLDDPAAMPEQVRGLKPAYDGHTQAYIMCNIKHHLLRRQ